MLLITSSVLLESLGSSSLSVLVLALQLWLVPSIWRWFTWGEFRPRISSCEVLGSPEHGVLAGAFPDRTSLTSSFCFLVGPQQGLRFLLCHFEHSCSSPWHCWDFFILWHGKGKGVSGGFSFPLPLPCFRDVPRETVLKLEVLSKSFFWESLRWYCQF